jgi:phosphoketolase
MTDFKQYLAESTKEYDYRIKVAGDLSEDFAARLETALKKYEVKSLSKGKKTPIQEVPLDFPNLKNQAVTIFELKTSYPASVFEMHSYISNIMRLQPNQLVVRKPGEPSEEYQEEIKAKAEQKSEFRSVLQDVEYKDAPKVKADEVYGDKANQSLLKELFKAKKEKIEFAAKPKVEQEVQNNEGDKKNAASPLTKSTNPHPDPKRK